MRLHRCPIMQRSMSRRQKDDILVLLHDNNLKRTTGLNANVWDMAYQGGGSA